MNTKWIINEHSLRFHSGSSIKGIRLCSIQCWSYLLQKEKCSRGEKDRAVKWRRIQGDELSDSQCSVRGLQFTIKKTNLQALWLSFLKASLIVILKLCFWQTLLQHTSKCEQRYPSSPGEGAFSCSTLQTHCKWKLNWIQQAYLPASVCFTHFLLFVFNCWSTVGSKSHKADREPSWKATAR